MFGKYLNRTRHATNSDSTMSPGSPDSPLWKCWEDLSRTMADGNIRLTEIKHTQTLKTNLFREVVVEYPTNAGALRTWFTYIIRIQEGSEAGVDTNSPRHIGFFANPLMTDGAYHSQTGKNFWACGCYSLYDVKTKRQIKHVGPWLLEMSYEK